MGTQDVYDIHVCSIMDLIQKFGKHQLPALQVENPYLMKKGVENDSESGLIDGKSINAATNKLFFEVVHVNV
jgi:hypothetical protein